ncbi:MAG: isoprenylcysteine carboxylmethyltransferase family protein [Pelolinea sp.]|jgi:protein-S-isoprenylcysteine O-methyltransferase Ste14|nr:isoprenylcysteine carboxylmethyltransferase family protein [Pelolinea sp.]
MDNKIFVRYVVRESVGIFGMGAALFWSAGTLYWWQAWAVLLIMLVWSIATAVVILRSDPSLLAERLGPRKGAKRWDTVIMSVLGLVQLVRYIVAGLDVRHGWSSPFSIAGQLVALVLCALGYVLMVWATASNRFFTQIVRIQKERGQTVVKDGPYRYVRHPGYLGAIVFEALVWVVLGSWWSAVPSGLGVMLLLVRTALEDKALKAELEGYAAYTQEVRYRLLPGIW